MDDIDGFGPWVQVMLHRTVPKMIAMHFFVFTAHRSCKLEGRLGKSLAWVPKLKLCLT